jgi:hypothetical protein
MTDGLGVWAYAITDQGGGADLSGLTGVAGTKVRDAVADGFTVLVSDVDLAEFGEAALRRNLENLTWLEGVARAHHRVIDAAARLFPLLPARLATVYSSDAAMAAALARRRTELRAALRRVGGRVEWGVKAYAAPRPDTREEPVPAPAGRATDAGAGGAGGTGGAGLAYLKRRRAQLTARESSQQAAVAGARAIHEELSGRAAQARLHPPQSPQLSGNQLPMLLNTAYLLDASASAGFASAVAAAATAHPELRLELTGPWPPYSFAEED